VKPLLRLGFLLGLGALAGYAGPDAASSSGAPIQLTARLVTPHDIALQWKDPAPGAAGHTVEWTMSPSHPYTILDFLPPGETTYRHSHLIPATTCYYRVRAFYGPSSAEVGASLPKNLTDRAYAAAFAKPENYQWAGPKTIPETGTVEKKSIRNPATAAAAAPGDFKVALVPITVSGLQLTWSDHAADAEGEMLEVKPADSPEFRVRALVPPGTNSFGWAFVPPNRQATFRIRPYYYGEPSNVVLLTTGPDSPAPPAAPSAGQ
jgi:hypothetical protein